MNKKVLIVTFLLVALILSGCLNRDRYSHRPRDVESFELEVQFLSSWVEVWDSPGEFHSRWASAGLWTYTEDIIPDKETAMTIATAILRGKRKIRWTLH